MRRRALIAGVVALATAPGARTRGQTRRHLGYLSGGAPQFARTSLDVLREALATHGWRAGDTIDIDDRWASGDASALPRLARELVALGPDVLVATGVTETRALRAASDTIPIVFLQAYDPVGTGLVDSITRPSGNVTGFSQGPQLLSGKQIDLLAQLLDRPPRRLAWMGNPGNLSAELLWSDMHAAALRIGADLARVDIVSAEDIDRAAVALANRDALVVQYDFLTAREGERVARVAAGLRLPAIYGNRSAVLAGGLMSYGPDLRENFRRGAAYVDRILRGARPRDLPVVEASQFELVINLKTAAALGLSVPTVLQAQADEVIE